MENLDELEKLREAVLKEISKERKMSQIQKRDKKKKEKSRFVKKRIEGEYSTSYPILFFLLLLTTIILIIFWLVI